MSDQETKWTKEHIDKAFEVIKRHKEQKPKHIRFLDRSIYWIILLVAIIGNLIILIPIIFFLFILKPLQLYPLLVLLGISFGALIEILIRNVEHLKKVHHIIFALIIPFLTLLNFFVITKMINNLEIAHKFNPLAIALVYSLSFILPYLYYQFVKKEI